MTIQHTPPSTYILRELHDVAVPESVSWLPQTVGWKVLAIIGGVALLYIGYRYARFRWDNRYRAEALKAIVPLAPKDPAMTSELFSIVKQVLIYHDNRYARLFGDAFLAALNQLMPTQPLFGDELAIQWVQSTVNPNVPLTESERATLKERAALWVKSHQEKASSVEQRSALSPWQWLKGRRHG
ncbi:TPA: DUF4381 domain-containing protein [Vibrio vulnificus]|uniref:DUF4381 domain-containing protein n=1 Tax=Vibrio vulnificus TaxID=672 RepID=UPI0019D45C53|nr:DUF4381 domain-containing protein [Vibrio vulnificus]EGQ8090665.1 DUF4381 domain-containing protein [Vibrio vulnificus]EHH0744304.1 DUF4381 domain-containing protein [Vibrio vulnificus]ELY5141571.1 DUF4381 domain-containing protein [Vibrio vulnificus]MBN8143584.1 DUF4381 domain-containing protein [Vibrio vulnificus]MCA0779329.1 DUF4381 domain-containing protein [Vibrio vulnificus]